MLFLVRFMEIRKSLVISITGVATQYSAANGQKVARMYVNQDQPCNTNDGSSLSEHCDSACSSTLKKSSRIDNSDLIYDSSLEDPSYTSEIIETLQEGRYYILLPQQVWNQLRLW